MVMKVLRQGAFGGFLKYILMSLLALSVLGLVFMDVQGVLKGGLGGTDVAVIGGETIGLRDFDRMARASLGRYNLTPEDIYKQNNKAFMDILAGEIRSRHIKLAADSLGVSLGQDRLQESLIKKIIPLKEGDESLQQTLDRLLSSQRIPEAEFMKNFSREVVADVLLESVQDGFGQINDNLASDLFVLQNQSRDLDVIFFDEEDIKGVEQPDEERLNKLYESYKNTQFKIPQRRILEVAYIDDSKLKDTLDISDDSLRKQYEERLEEFQVGEQKFLEQAVAPSAEESQSVLKLARDEKVPLREALGRVAGDGKGTHIPSAPIPEEMMPEVIRDAVAGAKAGDVVGPVETVMGHHVIKVGDIVAPHTRPFEEVKDALYKEAEQVALADAVYDLSNQLDDALAGGNSFEDAGQTVPLKISALPAMDAAGLDAERNDSLGGASEEDKSDKEIVLQEGFALQEGEVSRVFELPNGRFAAIRVKEILEESYQPFEKVRQKLADDFVQEQQRVENSRKISEFVKQIKAGETTLETVAASTGKKVKPISGIALSGDIPSPFKSDLKSMIFESQAGDILTLPYDGGAALVLLKKVHLIEIGEDQNAQIARIMDELNKELKDDVFNYYMRHVGMRYPSYINHDLLRAVYGKEDKSDGGAQ